MRRVFRLLGKPNDVFLRHTRAFSSSLPNSQGKGGAYYPHMVSQLTRWNADLRVKLMNDIKSALKSKDSMTATTLRSVLSDVQAADKAHKDGKIGDPAIRAFLARGISKRYDAASQYDKARRLDLASKERQEAEILQKLLPPALSESQIDEILKQIIDSLPISGTQRSLGQVFKAFYAQVDKSLVRPDVLKQRAQAAMTISQSSSSTS